MGSDNIIRDGCSYLPNNFLSFGGRYSMVGGEKFNHIIPNRIWKNLTEKSNQKDEILFHKNLTYDGSYFLNEILRVGNCYNNFKF